MRVLIFILWLTLGLLYGLIWTQRISCCGLTAVPGPDTSQLNSIPSNPSIIPSVDSTKQIVHLPSLPKSATPTPAPLENLVSASINSGEEEGCVLFKWGKAEPILRPCFETFRDSILKEVRKGQTLELINEYYEQENHVMASGDIGIVRSAKLKELFSNGINPDDIRLRSIARSDSTGKKNRLLYTLHIRHVFMNEQVKELDSKTLIYFKYASNQQENDVLVNQYIADLASRLKNNSDLVYLVGHTDDDASAEHNMTLGLKRAQIIKNLLVARGIKGSRIKISSRGEEEPISPNDTEENRKLNRRVELTISPSSN